MPVSGLFNRGLLEMELSKVTLLSKPVLLLALFLQDVERF